VPSCCVGVVGICGGVSGDGEGFCGISGEGDDGISARNVPSVPIEAVKVHVCNCAQDAPNKATSNSVAKVELRIGFIVIASVVHCHISFFSYGNNPM